MAEIRYYLAFTWLLFAKSLSLRVVSNCRNVQFVVFQQSAFIGS